MQKDNVLAEQSLQFLHNYQQHVAPRGYLGALFSVL